MEEYVTSFMDSGVDSVQPFFSIIIPTIRRVNEVAALLESISRSSFRSFEVLVIDQNLDGRLEEICHHYRNVFPIQHFQVNFTGLSRARNYGANKAIGHFLNFPDDDSEFFEKLLANAHGVIQAKGLTCLTGCCVNRDGDLSSAKFYQDSMFLNCRNMWGRLIETSIFIKRDLYYRVGGFDESFGLGGEFGADEGPELFVRLFQVKPTPKVFYSHEIQFYHPDNISEYDITAQARAFSYARGSGALFRKWPREVFGYFSLWLCKSLLGSLIYRGGKRKYYWNRVAGFFDGMWAYGRVSGGLPK